MLYDPLADLQQGLSIDKPKSPKERAKDREYEENTGEGFRKSKEKKFGLPYGDFVVEDEGNSEIEQTKKSSQEQLNKSREYPVLRRLFDMGLLSQNTIDQIKDQIQTTGSIDLKALDATNDEKSLISSFLDKLNPENKSEKQNLDNFKKDILQIKSLEGFNLELDSTGNFESEVLNKIGKNYIKFPDKDGNFDIEADFSTAIITTRNEILAEVKNIKVDSETYKVALQNIESGDLQRQIEGINSLYVLAYSNEGVLGKKTIEQYKKSRKSKLIEKARKIEKALQQENLASEQKQNLEKQKESIQKEMSELTGIRDGKKVEGGDVFKASKQDIANKSPEVETKQAA